MEDISLNPEQAYILNEEIEFVDEMGREIISRLTAIKPKYALIFGELIKGVNKPADIARNTGLKANRTCEDVKKVRTIAAKMYEELKK